MFQWDSEWKHETETIKECQETWRKARVCFWEWQTGNGKWVKPQPYSILKYVKNCGMTEKFILQVIWWMLEKFCIQDNSTISSKQEDNSHYGVGGGTIYLKKKKSTEIIIIFDFIFAAFHFKRSREIFKKLYLHLQLILHSYIKYMLKIIKCKQ